MSTNWFYLGSPHNKGDRVRLDRSRPSLPMRSVAVKRGSSPTLVSIRDSMQMLHPSQFQVNDAWIAFKLNDAPISTETDGDFNVVALMDAASCFILGTEFVSVDTPELSGNDAKRLLKTGESRKQQLPKTLFIPTDQPAKFLSREAERQGITVSRVSDAELEVFIGEARDGFRERFGGAVQ